MKGTQVFGTRSLLLYFIFKLHRHILYSLVHPNHTVFVLFESKQSRTSRGMVGKGGEEKRTPR